MVVATRRLRLLQWIQAQSARTAHGPGAWPLTATSLASTLALGAHTLQAQPIFVAAPLPDGLVDIGRNSAPTLADLDGDGDLDLLAGEDSGNFSFFENTGTANNPVFAEPQENPFGLSGIGSLVFFNAPTPRFTDFDDDGDFDLIAGERYGNFYAFENTGSTTDPAFDTPLMNPFGLESVLEYSTPSLIDIDGDGDLDLLSGEKYGTFLFFENTGDANTPAFVSPIVNPFNLSDIGDDPTPTFADLDGDGDFDLLTGEYYGSFLFFRNSGTPNAPSFTGPFTNPFGLDEAEKKGKPTLVDLDNDGDIDLLAGDLTGTFAYFENTENDPLPVELVVFTALRDEDAILLRWQTATETNNAGFEVQHLLDADTGAYEPLGFVEGYGTTTEARHYAFRVTGLPPSTHRFRLKQHDLDGSFSYSKTVTITLDEISTHSLSAIYPNPFHQQAQMTLSVAQDQPVRVAVYDLLGRSMGIIFDEALVAHTPTTVHLGADSWPSGLYIVVVEGTTFRTQRTVTLLH